MVLPSLRHFEAFEKVLVGVLPKSGWALRGEQPRKTRTPAGLHRQGFDLLMKFNYFTMTLVALGPLGESTSSNSTV